MNFYIYELKHFQIFSLSIQKVKLTFDMHNSLKEKKIWIWILDIFLNAYVVNC